ncbi:MAG: hypothetical protein EAZ37_03430 [Burkholderiales bacterium]|nr:MAG: hypothetical protein EAZ37_03430 [Burkholderiales bacterium]
MLIRAHYLFCICMIAAIFDVHAQSRNEELARRLFNEWDLTSVLKSAQTGLVEQVDNTSSNPSATDSQRTCLKNLLTQTDLLDTMQNEAIQLLAATYDLELINQATEISAVRNSVKLQVDVLSFAFLSAGKVDPEKAKVFEKQFAALAKEMQPAEEKRIEALDKQSVIQFGSISGFFMARVLAMPKAVMTASIGKVMIANFGKCPS